MDAIVPVPPSRKRAYQPVVEIAKAIGRLLSVPVDRSGRRLILVRVYAASRDVQGYMQSEEVHIANRHSIDIPRKGPRAPRPIAQSGSSSRSDLGSGRAIEGLHPRRAPSVAGRGQESSREGGPRARRCDLGLGCRAKRGETWTVAGGAAHVGKPCPAVIAQDNRFDANDSIVVCPLTTDPTPAPIFRLPIQPSAHSGLRASCRMMVGELTAVPRRRFGRLVGLALEEVRALNRAIFVFLGLSETEGQQQ